MSDNYLIHWAKGKEAKNHKYTAREWVNGSWQYIYGKAGGDAKKAYENSKTDYNNYQSTVRKAAYDNQVRNSFNKSSELYKNRSDAYKNQSNWEKQRSDFYSEKSKQEYGAASGLIDGREKDRLNSSASNHSNLATDYARKSKESFFKSDQSANTSERYSNSANKIMSNYDVVMRTNQSKMKNVKTKETAYKLTPLYALTTSITAGKKFFSSLFKVR